MQVRMKVAIRNRLRALMADAGFRSMEALAQETGISKNMLYLFERGKNSLSVDNICKLLWVLDCTFEDLIRYEISTNEPDHWDDLSQDVKEQIKVGREELKSLKRKRAV